MVTTLSYLLVAALVAAALYGIAVVVFGRGEELPPLPPRTSPTRLPDGTVTGADVRAVRLPQAVRGYRMHDVDWVLERVADELDRTAAERDELARQVHELEGQHGLDGPWDTPEFEVPEHDAEPAAPATRHDRRS